MRSRSLGIGSLLAVLTLPAATTLAQQQQQQTDQPKQQQTESQRVTYDPAVPVGAVRSYIDACRDGNYERAAERLDLSAIPKDQRSVAGPELAWKLKVVLDRKLWISYEKLSAQPEGKLDDGLPRDLDSLGTIDQAEILLQRAGGEWRFARSTVESVPRLYDTYGYGPLGRYLPAPMFDIRFLEIQLWQWIALLVLVFIAWLLSWVVTAVLYRVLRPLVARSETDLDDRLLDLLIPPSKFLIGLALFAGGTFALRLSVKAQATLGSVEQALSVIGVTWLLFRGLDVIAGHLRDRLEKQGHRTALAVVPLGRRAVKVTLIGLSAIVVLQNLGFNVTGLLAGLGVGGLAVALAAQKSIANLFGGVSMIADRPVRVGDFCRFGDQVGTIEEIGLRSTRVRTLDRTLVTVPNSEFSEMQLENFGVRDEIRLFTTIGLRYETTADQLRYVMAEMRRLLIEHPRITDRLRRVRFVGFGACSLDLEVFAYVDTTDFGEFVKVREDILLRLMDIVEQAGTGFAFPSQTLYLGRDGGLDAERAAEAEKLTRAWREEGKLPYPDFDEATVAEWKGKADWPPRGSVSAADAAR